MMDQADILHILSEDPPLAASCFTVADATPDLVDAECAAMVEALTAWWRDIDWDAEAQALLPDDDTADSERHPNPGLIGSSPSAGGEKQRRRFSDDLADLTPGVRLGHALEHLGLEYPTNFAAGTDPRGHQVSGAVSADADAGPGDAGWIQRMLSRFNGYDLVHIHRALRRQIIHLTALQMSAARLLVEASRPVADEQNRGAAWLIERASVGPVAAEDIATSEIETALGWTKRRAEHLVGLGMDLTQELTGAWAAMNTGDLDEGSATSLAEQVRVLPNLDDRRTAEANVMKYLRDGLAKGVRRTRRQINDKARTEVLKIDPDAADKRHQERVKQRGVWIDIRNSESTATVGIHDIAADDAAHIKDTLAGLADDAKRRGDERNRAQLMADAAVALLTGRAKLTPPRDNLGDTTADAEGEAHEPILADQAYEAGGKILLVTSITELLALADLARKEPARLGWIGPICTEVARRFIENNLLNPNMEFVVAVTRPETGDLASLHPIGRRFRGALRDAIVALNPECEWPTCSRPATDSEIDHRHDHQHGGGTEAENGGPKCRTPHHRYKTLLGWDQIPYPGQPGRTLLVSPHGHQYPAETAPLVAPTTGTEAATQRQPKKSTTDEPPF